MFVRRLDQVRDDLTSSEETIALYISNHLEEVSHMTSSQLAEITGVAQATVVRFSQKMGYASFKKMIRDISTSSMADEHVTEDIDPQESVEETKERLGKEFEIIYDLVSKQNSNQLIKEVVDAIFEAESVVVFGYTSRKYDLAHHFVGLLLKIGINAYTDSFPSAIYAKLELMKENDCIIILSESGETRETINFAKIARKKGIKVVSITRVLKNSLAKYSDYNLKVVEYGNRTFLRNTMMMFAYEVVIDLLYLNLIKKDPERSNLLSSINSTKTKLHYIESE